MATNFKLSMCICHSIPTDPQRRNSREARPIAAYPNGIKDKNRNANITVQDLQLNKKTEERREQKTEREERGERRMQKTERWRVL